MDPQLEHQMRLTRRQLFGLASGGIGTAALAALLSEDLRAADAGAAQASCRTCRISRPRPNA